VEDRATLPRLETAVRIATWIPLSLATFAHAQGPPRQPEATVVGRVVDVLGDGVPAADVRFLDADDIEVRRAAADGEGMFRASRLPPVPLRLRAGAPDRADATIRLPRRETTSIRVVLEDAVSLRGTVTAGGKPLADAFVVAVAPQLALVDGTEAWRTEVRTDANGRYATPRVPLRGVAVCAWAPGHAHRFAEVRMLRNSTLDFDVRPAAPAVRTVRVQGLPADAIAAARIRLGLPDDDVTWYVPASLRSVRLGTGGEGTLPVLPRPHYVSVAVEGYRSTPTRLNASAGSADEIAFTLDPLPNGADAPSALLQGHVADGSGNAVGGVRLFCVDNRRERRSSATSAADGAFSIATRLRENEQCVLGVEAGAWRIDERLCFADRTTGIATTANPERTIAITVQPSASIAGTARRADGGVLAFADVVIEHDAAPRRPKDGARHPTATDQDGHFSMTGLACGSYTVTVTGLDGSIGRATVAAEAGAVAHVDAFEFAPTGWIEGTLVGRDGEPRRGEMLRVKPFGRG
jgi:hypothetical protein